MSEASERAARLAKRDAKIGGVCVLCYVGYPSGSWRCGPHHHIKPRGMGGTKDPFSEDPRNLAPCCPPHHARYEPNRGFWVSAMIKSGLYSEADYIGTPLEFYLSTSDVSAPKLKRKENRMKKEGFEEVLLEGLVTGDPSRAIEAQEARGQHALVESDILPIKCNFCTREQFQEMGIIFGEPVDDLFIEVQLPNGWKKMRTDHSLWSKLVDEKGRERASIFYKAAFYDKDAFISLTRRFSCRVEPVCGYSDPEYRKHKWHCVVIDCGNVVWESDEQVEPEPPSSERDTWLAWANRKDDLKQSGVDWLDENYPDWENYLAHWD